MSEARQWMPVRGYEGVYEVSNDGVVRSLDRVVHHDNGTGERFVRGRTLRPFLSGPEGRKRRMVALFRDGRGDKQYIYVLMLEAFEGPRPAGMAACHNNGDRVDDRLENLRWDTYSANSYDAVDHGVNWQAAKTHCPKGHEYTPENTGIDRGHRYCKKCQPEWRRRAWTRANAKRKVSPRTCYLCGRTGNRGFHQMLIGDTDRWRCNSARACDNRRYRQFMGLE